MSIAVISSVYGGYDHPADPCPQDVDCEWVLVSDTAYATATWKTIVEPRPQFHPRLAAKVAKCRPDLYADADIYLWVDASVRISRPDFVSTMINALGDCVIGQIPHPDRTRLADELSVSLGISKYNDMPIREQVTHYLEAGYPDGWGLWATGVIARAGHGWPLKQFGNEWLMEQLRWSSYQDQLSEPPVLHRMGLRPVSLPGPLYGNPLFEIRGHNA